MRQIAIPNNLKISEDYPTLIQEIKKSLELKENLGDDLSVFIITGQNSFDLLAKDIIEDLKASKILISFKIIDTQNFNIESQKKLSQESANANYLIGIGAGKVLDIAKYIAALNNKKFISIPSLISHDGICSPVSVINGQSLAAIMPSALLVPLYLIQESPIKYIQAGIGDLLANLSAIEDWHLAAEHNNEEIDDFAIMLSQKATINVLQRLSIEIKRNGANIEAFLKSKAFLTALIESIALSGIAMSIAGNSRPCSGAEHMISHAIDHIYGAGSKTLHGIQVAIATIYLDELRQDKKLIHNYQIKDIFKSIGSPISFSEINISQEEFQEVLKLSPSMRKGRFTFFNLSQIKA